MMERLDATWPPELMSMLVDIRGQIDRLSRVVGDLERQIDQLGRAA